MKLVLLIESPAGTVQRTQTLESSYAIVGRSKVHVSVEDPRCSSQHFVLFQGLDGRLYARDLESTNGTYFMGKRINEVELKVGNRIAFGRSALVVMSFKPVLPPKPSAPVHSSDNSNEETLITTPTTPPPKKAEVIHSWPQALQALPPSKQEEFICFVDDEGTRSVINVDDLKTED